MFLPERKRVQRTEAIVSAANPELRKIVAVLALAMTTLGAVASPSSALRKYESGQYKDAYQEYSRLVKRRPDDVRLQYNAGAAAFKAQQYENATNHFSAALSARDLQLQEHAYYNLGDSLYKLGEEQPEGSPGRIQNWERSVAQFDSALKLDPKDADAKANLEFVKEKLKEEKQKQQQQQQQQQSKDNKDQKQDQDENKDQQKQDQKSKQDQKDQKDQQQAKDQKDQQKQEQQQQSKEEQEKKKDQAKKSQQDKEKEQSKDQAASQQGDQKPENRSETNGTANAQEVIPGQMSPEQAKQLLDSQKNKERTLMFIPPGKPNKPNFKDW
jgi:Ca-activated chloride channel family protein